MSECVPDRWRSRGPSLVWSAVSQRDPRTRIAGVIIGMHGALLRRLPDYESGDLQINLLRVDSRRKKLVATGPIVSAAAVPPQFGRLVQVPPQAPKASGKDASQETKKASGSYPELSPPPGLIDLVVKPHGRAAANAGPIHRLKLVPPPCPTQLRKPCVTTLPNPTRGTS
jgi:hypothetical protein